MTNDDAFTLHADLYVESAAHAETPDLEEALAWLGDPEDWEVLDVATGTGHTAFFFAQRLAHVFAIDRNPAMLGKAQEEADRKSFSCRFLRGEADDLPFDDQTFDLVVCRLAAHHFENPAGFVAESARVLRPGGRLLIIDNTVPEGEAGEEIDAIERWRDPGHHRCLTLSQWEDHLKPAGMALRQSAQKPQTLDYDDWMERAGRQAQERETLWERLGAASPAVRDWLGPRQDGTHRQLTLMRLLLLADKPSA